MIFSNGEARFYITLNYFGSFLEVCRFYTISIAYSFNRSNYFERKSFPTLENLVTFATSLKFTRNPQHHFLNPRILKANKIFQHTLIFSIYCLNKAFRKITGLHLRKSFSFTQDTAPPVCLPFTNSYHN